MRTLAVAAALLALPVVPAHAAPKPPPTTTWVVERTSPRATSLTIRGGAGAGDHEWAMAAVASATVGPDGRFSGAEGGLFFGTVADGDPAVHTPAGTARCSDLPSTGTVCATTSVAAIGFMIWWDDVTFNRAFVVLRGRRASVDLGERGDSPGWRLRRWTGPVRVVADTDAAGADAVLASADGFTTAHAVGGPHGSIAIGHPPCRSVGYTGAGTGAVRLVGGVEEKVATCADFGPPAAYKPGSTEWTFSGAAAGMSDVPARLVVIERPLS
jgi:hypothetical protein